MITDTFTVRVGAIFTTRVAFIVVSVDFFINAGGSSFSKWSVVPIGCVVEYSGCKLYIIKPGIIMFFYCESGRKKIDIFDVTEYFMNCFYV